MPVRIDLAVTPKPGSPLERITPDLTESAVLALLREQFAAAIEPETKLILFPFGIKLALNVQRDAEAPNGWRIMLIDTTLLNVENV